MAREANSMENITDEMSKYICDMVCGNLDDVKNQEDADNICFECKLGQFVCDILNEYNTVNDFEKSQLCKVLQENAKLKKKLGE